MKEAEWAGSYEDELDRLNQQSMRKINLMNGQLISCGQELAETQQLLAEHMRRGEQAEREKDALRVNYSARDHDLLLRDNQLAELRAEATRKEGVLQGLRRQLEELSTSLAREQHEHEQTAEHYDRRLAEQMQRARDAQRWAEEERAGREGVEGELREYLEQVSGMLAQQSGELGAALHQQGALQGELAELNSRYGQKEGALTEQQATVYRQASAMDRLKVYISQLRQRLAGAETERQRVGSELGLCKKQIQLQREEIEELEERWLKAEEEKVDEVEKLKVLSEEERENYAAMEEEALTKQRQLEIQLREMKLH